MSDDVRGEFLGWILCALALATLRVGDGDSLASYVRVPTARVARDFSENKIAPIQSHRESATLLEFNEWNSLQYSTSSRLGQRLQPTESLSWRLARNLCGSHAKSFHSPSNRLLFDRARQGVYHFRYFLSSYVNNIPIFLILQSLLD